MTGLDRLRELADDMIVQSLWGVIRDGKEEPWNTRYGDGRTVDNVLRAIADQIEAEQEERITRRVEDREAAEWVRAHGGLDAVKGRWQGRIARTHVEHMAERQRERRERMQRHIEYIQRLCAERREVAARLRNVEMHAIPDARIADNPMTVEFIAAAIFYDLPYVRGLFSRLADLIEPDTTTVTTKSPELTTKCDRDALLALVDELEKPMRDGGYSKRIARRIREALGVKHG